MKKILILITVLAVETFSQSPAFYPSEVFRVSGYGMGFNIEVYDINNDGKQDIIVGNWNDTYVYYGGAALLDSTVDITYTGRCLAVCDYNGDGYRDLITMHFTSYDSTRNDYNGEILFYYGSNTTPNIDTIPEYSIPLPTLYPTRDYFSFAAFKPGIEYGDFNNDGKTDVVIHSMISVVAQDNIGITFIYMGSEVPPDTATFKVQGKGFVPGEAPIYYFGDYFQVGNINGDNYDDLILSSRVQTIPPSSQDSLDVLHIYLGNDNFTFVEGGESLRYESRLKNNNYSYGWFKREISMMDINGDGFSDLIIAHGKDSTDHIHYGSINVIDTIPSFYLTDPDTTREDIVVGAMCHDIGDWNSDGYNDFLLKQSGFKSFTAHLGGPYINNRNPYGLKGLLEAHDEFPSKATSCTDQNGDGIKDFVVTADPYHASYIGYVIIYKGRDDIVVSVDNEKEELVPATFSLEQNYPNPFNPITTIQFALRSKQVVTILVYDLLGNEVTTLVNEEKQSGKYEIKFDAEKYKLSSGTYFYKLKTSQGELSRKMIYLK